jgi:hypothetical protein
MIANGMCGRCFLAIVWLQRHKGGQHDLSDMSYGCVKDEGGPPSNRLLGSDLKLLQAAAG